MNWLVFVRICCLLLLPIASTAGSEPPTARGLPLAPDRLAPATNDWLVRKVQTHATAFRGSNDRELLLDNGLIRRTFLLTPNVATVGLDDLRTGTSMLRAVKPEAQVSLDGTLYDIGGLTGQPERAFLLPEWFDQLVVVSNSFRCTGFKTGPAEAPFDWKRKRHSADLPWPPPGIRTTFTYAPASGQLKGFEAEIIYEMYDGLPVIAKQLRLHNGTGRKIVLDSFRSEILGTAEVESAVDERAFRNWRLPLIDFLSDYSFHGMDATTASQTVAWLPDPAYTSQVNYELKMPAMVASTPPIGPALELPPGETFESFRTCAVVHDSTDRERQGLALRRAQRALAPWATENPVMMHVRSAETKVFRNAVDQCAEVGFEMIIYTFGSGLNMEDTRPEYIARIKADVDYAHSKGIEVGAYSLLASRRVNDAEDVINPKTGKPGGAIFGNSPCLCSRWGDEYFRRIRTFIEQTGLDLLEHDGSYPGDVCASTNHPGHRGLEDSQWSQWKRISEFYQWCRARGVYLNVPDYYFLAGSSKTGMGYRESNWSLPRERQIILGRQNIFDGTWTKAPSMGWMFVPLVEYQGGGAAATLEPLHEHLDAYAAHLANNFGAGVQACYRGPRLYDTDETKATVAKWVGWFKKHREILESDLIHVRRPDGRDIDYFLHVNPALPTKAFVVFYNPLKTAASRTVHLPLYYAGLNHEVTIREQDGPVQRGTLDRLDHLDLPVQLEPAGITWFSFE